MTCMSNLGFGVSSSFVHYNSLAIYRYSSTNSMPCWQDASVPSTGRHCSKWIKGSGPPIRQNPKTLRLIEALALPLKPERQQCIACPQRRSGKSGIWMGPVIMAGRHTVANFALLVFPASPAAPHLKHLRARQE